VQCRTFETECRTFETEGETITLTADTSLPPQTEAKTITELEMQQVEAANAVSIEEAIELYKTFAVPGSGAPLFQAAANLYPWTEARDRQSPPRGALVVAGGLRLRSACGQGRGG
jgi:hypothetical protein